MGTLKMYGYLRGGRNLDANSLIYIPSLGTYQMSEVYVFKRQVDKNNNSNGVCKENGVSGVWELAQESEPSRQESLESEAQYDEMNAEQTWPTEQELKDGEYKLVFVISVSESHNVNLSKAEVKHVKKKVPKGTSDYQAAWILDSDEEEETDEEDDDDEDEDDEDNKENDDEEDSDEEEEDDDEELEEEEEDDDNEDMETVWLEKYPLKI